MTQRVPAGPIDPGCRASRRAARRAKPLATPLARLRISCQSRSQPPAMARAMPSFSVPCMGSRRSRPCDAPNRMAAALSPDTRARRGASARRGSAEPRSSSPIRQPKASASGTCVSSGKSTVATRRRIGGCPAPSRFHRHPAAQVKRRSPAFPEAPSKVISKGQHDGSLGGDGFTRTVIGVPAGIGSSAHKVARAMVQSGHMVTHHSALCVGETAGRGHQPGPGANHEAGEPSLVSTARDCPVPDARRGVACTPSSSRLRRSTRRCRQPQSMQHQQQHQQQQQQQQHNRRGMQQDAWKGLQRARLMLLEPLTKASNGSRM